jgi:hypothetical protein
VGTVVAKGGRRGGSQATGEEGWLHPQLTKRRGSSSSWCCQGTSAAAVGWQRAVARGAGFRRPEPMSRVAADTDDDDAKGGAGATGSTQVVPSAARATGSVPT